jgi:hypothetical protein
MERLDLQMALTLLQLNSVKQPSIAKSPARSLDSITYGAGTYRVDSVPPRPIELNPPGLKLAIAKSHCMQLKFAADLCSRNDDQSWASAAWVGPTERIPHRWRVQHREGGRAEKQGPPLTPRSF